MEVADIYSIPKEPDSHYFDKVVSKGKRIGISITRKAYQAISSSVDALDKIKNDTSSTLKLCRFSRYVLIGLEHNHQSINIINLRSKFEISRNVLDSFLFIGDLDYWINSRYKKEGEPINKMSLLGNAVFTAVDFGSVLSWLNNLKILDLGGIANAIGKVPILKIITNTSLSTYLGLGAVIGITFFAADALKRTVNAQNKEQRIKAFIDVTGCVTRIALVTFTLSGGTNVPTLVALGILSGGMGLGAFLYSEYHKEALKTVKPTLPNQQNSVEDVHAVKVFFGRLSKIVKNTKTLDKLSKIIVSTIDLAREFHLTDTTAPLYFLRKQLKVTAELSGVFNLVSRLRDWTCPEKVGVKGKEKPFWLNFGTSKAKIIGKAFLTLGTLCDFFKFLNSSNMISLGLFSASIGTLPVLTLIKLGTINISGYTNLMDCHARWHKINLKEDRIETKIEWLNFRIKETQAIQSSKVETIERKLHKWSVIKVENEKEKKGNYQKARTEILKIIAISSIIGLGISGVQTIPTTVALLSYGIFSNTMMLMHSG
jgi:hypothetical protein